MSGDVQVVTQRFALPTSGGATTDFTIPALGWTPKAVEIIAVNATANATIAANFAISHGYADASNQGVCGSSALDNPSGNSEASRCYSESRVIRLLDPGTDTVDGAFSIDSLIANGVRLGNDNFPSAANFALITFFGGADLSVAVRNVLLTGSSPSISSLGFDPNFALFAGIETASSAETVEDDAQISHGVAAGPTLSQRSLNTLFRNASFNASASAELTSDYVSSVPGTATQGSPEYGVNSFGTGELIFDRPVFGGDMRCVALVADTDTCGVFVGTFNPPTTNIIASTGDLGFEPGFVGMGISRLREVDEYNSNVNSNLNYLSRFDGSREFTIGICGEDNARPDDNRSWCDAKAFSAVDEDDAVFFDGSFEDFRGSPDNDARINFATTSGTQRRAYYWAIEAGTAPAGSETGVITEAAESDSVFGGVVASGATMQEGAESADSSAAAAGAFSLFQSDAQGADSYVGQAAVVAAIQAASESGDGLGGLAAAIGGIVAGADAGDPLSGGAAMTASLVSGGTGDAVLDALAQASAAILAGADAGDQWIGQATALADLLASGEADSVLVGAVAGVEQGLLTEGSQSAESFLAAATALASITSAAQASDAIVAIIATVGGISEAALSGDAFSTGSQLQAALNAPGIADVLFSARSITATAISAGAIAGAAFESTGGDVGFITGALSIQAAITATLSSNPSIGGTLTLN